MNNTGCTKHYWVYNFKYFQLI